jgi:hypothetical protein
MDKGEYKKFKKELEILNLPEAEKLKLKIEGLKKHLEKVRNDFSNYKVHVNFNLMSKIDNHRYLANSTKDALETERLKNDSLINFILENGLGRNYYKRFVEEFYPYDVLDFINKNEVNFSNYSISEKGNKELKGRIQFKLSQLSTSN